MTQSMNIPIKTHSISSKTDQGPDQETWILISLNNKYSIQTNLVLRDPGNEVVYKPSKNYTPNPIPKTVQNSAV